MQLEWKRTYWSWERGCQRIHSMGACGRNSLECCGRLGKLRRGDPDYLQETGSYNAVYVQTNTLVWCIEANLAGRRFSSHRADDGGVGTIRSISYEKRKNLFRTPMITKVSEGIFLYGFLFSSYWKLMPHALLATLLPLWWFLIGFLMKAATKFSSDCPHRLVAVSCLILVENWYQILFWMPSSSGGGFLFNSFGLEGISLKR